MKINYRLEIEYQVFEKGRTFFETKSYEFNSKNSQQNRNEVLNKYESFQHVFYLASKITNNIKLSVADVVNKNISGFKIPFLNIYYSSKEFSTENPGSVLFGGYLNEFDDRINSLVCERKVYKTEKIKGFTTELIKDYQGKTYKIITNSPFDEEDCCKLNIICN